MVANGRPVAIHIFIPKIVFFDIDGTLLEMGKTEITPNMRKALCSLKQKGQWDVVMKVREIAYLSDNLSYYIFCTINLLI